MHRITEISGCSPDEIQEPNGISFSSSTSGLQRFTLDANAFQSADPGINSGCVSQTAIFTCTSLFFSHRDYTQQRRSSRAASKPLGGLTYSLANGGRLIPK
jgi:hypothetical protein